MRTSGPDAEVEPRGSIRQLLITGGWAHEFERTAPHFAACAAQANIRTDTVDDLDDAVAALSSHDYDLVTVYACWFTMAHTRYDEVRAHWARRTPSAFGDELMAHVEDGRGLLALHTAPICFDDWPAWGDLLGGRWNWNRSWHPAPGAVAVSLDAPIGRRPHPIVDQLEPFEVIDERYTDLDVADDVEVLAWSDAERQPAVWAHRFGAARIVVDTLGHDERSLDQLAHATILRRSMVWVAGFSDDAVRATT